MYISATARRRGVGLRRRRSPRSPFGAPPCPSPRQLSHLPLRALRWRMTGRLRASTAWRSARSRSFVDADLLTRGLRVGHHPRPSALPGTPLLIQCPVEQQPDDRRDARAWLNRRDWKSRVGATLPRVRIPLSPPMPVLRAGMSEREIFSSARSLPSRRRSRIPPSLSEARQSSLRAEESAHRRKPSLLTS